MTDMESSLKNMILTLLTITLVASLAVGVVYRVTAGPIAEAKAAKITQAIAKVLPPFDNRPGDSVQALAIDGGEIKIYQGTRQGQTVGYAIETFSNNGFGGIIRLMAGFLPDGTIYRVETLSQTPGPSGCRSKKMEAMWMRLPPPPSRRAPTPMPWQGPIRYSGR